MPNLTPLSSLIARGHPYDPVQTRRIKDSVMVGVRTTIAY